MDGAGNYYFAEPDKIDKLLSVEVYAQYMPTIPVEELHASSVQHPTHPQYRWLLHSRRVPKLEQSPEDETRSVASKSTHPSGFRCAGIGDAEQRAYICKVCRNALCRENPVMPWCALANLFWGGREHLDYQGLNDAMRMILGRGRPMYRKMILGKGNPSDSSAAIVGNHILLAQPTTGNIQAVLPPPPEQLSDRLSVVFTTSKQEVSSAKPLWVSREKYLRCARLRQSVCYAFADVLVSEENARVALPEDGVPEIFLQEAVEMAEAEKIKPSMDGPAKLREPGCKAMEEVDAEDDKDEEGSEEENEDDAEKISPACIQPEEEIAECILGLDEGSVDDPMSQLVFLQKRLQLLKDEGDKLAKKQQRAQQKEELPAADHVAIAASTEQSRQHFLSLRELTSAMISRGEDVLTVQQQRRNKKQSAERGETSGEAVQDPVSLPHAAADALRDSLLQHDPELPMNVRRNMHQLQSGVDVVGDGALHRRSCSSP